MKTRELLLIYCYFTSINTEEIDCIIGETWYEVCKKCTCLENAPPDCQYESSLCDIGGNYGMEVLYGSHVRCHFSWILGKTICINFNFQPGKYHGMEILFQSDMRCHYSWKMKRAICVSIKYQTDLAGKPCQGNEYIYDTCTFCRCDGNTNTFLCNSGDCRFNNGGLCNEYDKTIEDCNECRCTFTKFRRCQPLEKCIETKVKPGNCPRVYTTFPNIVQYLCITQKNQDCYTDYGCPGEKKCCKMANCFFGCTVPVS